MREYQRVLNPALHGCETFDFSADDLPQLREQLSAFPGFSVHAPLPTWPDYPGPAAVSFLLNPDPVKRQASLDMLHHTIGLAADWGARYVVVHFGGVNSNGLSAQEVLALADDAAAQLETWAAASDMSLHLEYCAYNPHFDTPEELVAVVKRHEHLHVCLDIGHLRLSAAMLERDEWEMAQQLAPLTRSMHLWTTRGRADERRYRHVPVHPSLTPDKGWIDVLGMVQLVRACVPACALVFEPHHLYNPDLDWQAEGMDWVREMIGAI